MDLINNNLTTQIALGSMQGNPGITGGLQMKLLRDDPASPVKEASPNADFGSMLKDKLNELNQTQLDADKAAETYATGGDIQLHDVMIATEKADLQFGLALQIRNKLLSAYQEISRMSV